ncbi:hypothetical protein [Citrobacter arsenatis]|uniref:hypothetical protein n=1 Tax=Citrobacter arsenatis TaxID=2546350 RepID=UPI00300E06B6
MWRIRNAIPFFDLTGLECHPDKTRQGKIAQGFDWSGVWFTDNGATGIAPRANENHRLRRLRFTEQSRRAGLTEPEIHDRVQLYDRRWLTWAESMLSAAGLYDETADVENL